jgi:hypothetical protein
MGALHQPDLEPGPHHDLVEALHRLHSEAGRPSLRRLARTAGCSHTTLSHVFSQPHLPAWGPLEALVLALSGDLTRFRELWLAATARGSRHVPSSRRIAGRRAELVVLRRHLEAGSGLILVVGEGGLGKTTLVTTASEQVSCWVAHARGRALLTGEPFALVADALREVHAYDDGVWLNEALVECPNFVGPSLSRILPELETEVVDAEDRFALDRMFAAVQSVLSSLGRQRPLALILEDLQWADAGSLACLEWLAVGSCRVPVVGTLRRGESPAADAWLKRVRRDSTYCIDLPPLTAEETEDQIRLLVGAHPTRTELERVHRLSRGLPLFTRELATSMSREQLPDRLSDALASDLDGLTPSARAVIAVAAAADRPLPPRVVGDAAAMDGAELDEALRELVIRHLLAGPYDTSDVALRHPMLAATVRAQLTPGEAASVHRRVAAVLAAASNPAGAEVAEHWRLAANPREELRWRVTAARTACARQARAEETSHWERALALWPGDGPPPAAAGVTRAELLLEAVHAMIGQGRTAQAAPLVDEALALGADLTNAEHALALRRSSQVMVATDPESAVLFAQEAVAALADLEDQVARVQAMGDHSSALRGAGRYEEADEVTAAALRLSAGLGDLALHREVLIERAWHDVVAGRTQAGLSAADEASRMHVAGDHFGEVWLGTFHTDLLLMCCASGDEVAEAAEAGLEATREADIEMFILSTLLVCNVVEARISEGAVPKATRMIRPYTKDRPRQTTRFLHIMRSWVDVLRGELDGASKRLEAVAALDFDTSSHRQAQLIVEALCDLWLDQPGTALSRIGNGIAEETATSWSPYTGTLLTLAARAAADVAFADPPRRQELATELSDTLQVWRRQWSDDPFGFAAPHVAMPATYATWRAELARLDDTATVARWTEAADLWDRIRRPHDAGYCRWRAAELSLADGQGTITARLLRRAHANARGHVPLLRRIDQLRLSDLVEVRSPVPASRLGDRATTLIVRDDG